MRLTAATSAARAGSPRKSKSSRAARSSNSFAPWRRASSIAPSDTLPETRLVRAVLDALGIEHDALSPEYKARAADVAKRWMATRRL